MPFGRWRDIRDGGHCSPHTWPHTFWSKPVSIFGLFLFTAFISTSLGLTCPGWLPPTALMWHSPSWLRVDGRSEDRGYVVPRASDPTVASDARRGSRPMAEHRVMSELLTSPDVPPSVCYPGGRHRQRRGPKPGGQRNLDLRIGRERASRHGDCQHPGGRDPGWGGTVNPGEASRIVVTKDKPKMLTGLGQKGRWSGAEAPKPPPPQMVYHRQKRRDLNPGAIEKVNVSVKRTFQLPTTR